MSEVKTETLLAAARRKVDEASAEAERTGALTYKPDLTPAETKALQDADIAAIIMAPKIRVTPPAVFDPGPLLVMDNAAFTKAVAALVNAGGLNAHQWELLMGLALGRLSL